MTLGIDVSPLFSEMCLVGPAHQLSYTKDIISKKMIYLYLNNYAEHNSGLAIMAINSFLKDCEDKDSKIRGLALRSLCSLRFDGVYDYIKPQVLKMLNDLDPYVRKTAINGCIKLSYLHPHFVDGSTPSRRKRHHQHPLQLHQRLQQDGRRLCHQRAQRNHAR